MDSEIADDVPCSSLAVESIIRIGTAGLIWGACAGPYDAKQRGLVGLPRASFVAKSIAKCGFQCGVCAGIFTFTHCRIQSYRRQKDAVNALVAGAVAGAAIGAGRRNWKQVALMASLISTLCAVADNSKAV